MIIQDEAGRQARSAEEVPLKYMRSMSMHSTLYSIANTIIILPVLNLLP